MTPSTLAPSLAMVGTCLLIGVATVAVALILANLTIWATRTINKRFRSKWLVEVLGPCHSNGNRVRHATQEFKRYKHATHWIGGYRSKLEDFGVSGRRDFELIKIKPGTAELLEFDDPSDDDIPF